MEKNNNSPKDSSNDLRCIWMTSKLVEYKLCDKEFDCENCEFDKVIRNLSKKPDENKIQDSNTDLIEKTIKKIEDESFDQNLIYLKNQFVLKRLFGNAYYLGINPIILSLMDEINFVKEFSGNDVKKEQIIFTMEGNWGRKDFISPINFLILGKISIIPGKFNNNKWHYIVLFNNEEMGGVQLKKEEWMNHKQNAITMLKAQLKNKPAIGESLMDGGEKIEYLYQYLGHQKYLELLNNIF